MLDEALPTYTFRQSNENPLHTILNFTHNGSNPTTEYLMKRPRPSDAPNQYALGLIDPHYQSIIYGEILIKPELSQPTLSAAEIRAQNGSPNGNGSGMPPTAILPDAVSVSLYNPDQAIVVRRNQGSWKSDSWEFEMPEQTFHQPSGSRLDRDGGDTRAAELAPKVMFRWKRDGRLSRDMTCYLCGRSVNGKKNKEPDITVALFRGGKNESSLTIYEPNMARVDVEDRKGLEVVFLLSAEVIRDLYLSPRQDPFNISVGAGSAAAGAGSPSRGRRRTNSRPSGSPAAAAAVSSGAIPAMSGALNNAAPSPPGAGPASTPAGRPSSGGRDKRTQADIDAETKRLQAMVAEEERQARERRDQEEQQRIKQMLEQEEADSRRRREAEIDAETERLRREYGVGQQGQQGQQLPPPQQPRPQGSTSPALPPRPSPGQPQNGGWFGGPARPQQPPRPQSMGPGQTYNWNQGAEPPQQQQPPPPNGSGSGGAASSGRKKLGKLFQGPYAGPAAASVSGFFGGSSSNNRAEEEKKKKVQKKRSVHF